MFHVSKHFFFKGKESCLEKYRKKIPLGALWHIYHSIWQMGKNIIYRNSWDPTIEHGRGLEGWMAWDWGPIALAMDQSSVSKYPGQAAHNYLQLQGSDTLF